MTVKEHASYSDYFLGECEKGKGKRGRGVIAASPGNKIKRKGGKGYSASL